MTLSENDDSVNNANENGAFHRRANDDEPDDVGRSVNHLLRESENYVYFKNQGHGPHSRIFNVLEQAKHKLRRMFMRSFNMRLITYFIALLVIASLLSHSNHDDFKLAFDESQGYFQDIRSIDWNRMKQRIKNQAKHAANQELVIGNELPKVWYQMNYEPNFTCMYERRIGGNPDGMGDGAKWICDPHRIDTRRCLVYSIGSNGDFSFEMSILKNISTNCEIHTFDPKPWFGDFIPKDAERKIIFHPWGIANEESLAGSSSRSHYKTLTESIKELGHVGCTIDIFKIDCERCEWFTYTDWFTNDVTLKQILVEAHEYPSVEVAAKFFDRFQDEGYVMFHKEPNTLGCDGECVEFSFLKLSSKYFT